MFLQIDKKRIGFCREMARKKLKTYFEKKPPFRLPIPIEELAIYFGFEIYQLDNLGKHQRAIMYSIENRKLIGVNSKYPLVNRRFSIGHELAHNFLDHPGEEDCTDEERKIYDREADEFSSELLIPFSDLKSKIQKLNKDELCKIYLVSEQALLIKISSQNMLDKLIV